MNPKPDNPSSILFQRPLIPLLLAFIGGILCAVLLLPQERVVFFLAGGCMGLVLAGLFFLPPAFQKPLLLLLFFLFGSALTAYQTPDSVLQPLAAARSEVVLQGTVLEAPRLFPEKARLYVQVEKLIRPEPVRSLHEKVQVTVYKNFREFRPGERVRFPARLARFKNFNNPGQYDQVRAMELKGLVCAASVADGRYLVPMGRGDLGFPLQAVEKARRPIREFFKQNMEARDQALMRALILGEQQEIDAETREAFNKAGLGHILAVSGFNIALVAGLIFFPLKWLLGRFYRLSLTWDTRKPAAVVTALAVIVYTGLSGLEYSSQRAMIMALAYLFSVFIGREKELWSTLALAALAVLAVNPLALFSVSFQLSFGAVIGLIWLTPAFFSNIPVPSRQSTFWNRAARRIILSFGGAVAATLGATIMVLPLTSYYFYRTSLVVLPANLTVVPFYSFWIIPVGLLASLALPVAPDLARLLLQAAAWGLKGSMAVTEFWSGFEYSALWTVRPNGMEMVLFYGLLFFIFYCRRRIMYRIGLALLILVAGADAGYWIYKTRHEPHLRITYLDVGQGNAALVQFPGRERMLIDGGGFFQDDFDVGRMVVAPFLLTSKITTVDYLVLTHPEADHMNGLRFIAANFKPREFWWNGERGEEASFEELMRILEQKKIKALRPLDLPAGRESSGVTVSVLHPRLDSPAGAPGNSTLSANDKSLVLKLEHGGHSFLFTGDLEKKGEELLVSGTNRVLQSEILLAGHHGSNSSSSESFLNAVRPGFCVISAGGRNAFGFPHASVVKRLEQIGCRILRVDRVGAVRMEALPDGLKIKTFLKTGESFQPPKSETDQAQEE